MNDELYMSLHEIVENYTPKTKLSEELVEDYLNKFLFLEEGDTTITGSFRDWLLFVGKIIDMYELKKN